MKEDHLENHADFFFFFPLMKGDTTATLVQHLILKD